MKYTVLITPSCQESLLEISDPKLRENVFNDIANLENEPDTKGNPLSKELKGFYSIRSSNLYRIIYKIDNSSVVIYALGVAKTGDRKNTFDRNDKNQKRGFSFSPVNPNFSTKHKRTKR